MRGEEAPRINIVGGSYNMITRFFAVLSCKWLTIRVTWGTSTWTVWSSFQVICLTRAVLERRIVFDWLTDDLVLEKNINLKILGMFLFAAPPPSSLRHRRRFFHNLVYFMYTNRYVCMYLLIAVIQSLLRAENINIQLSQSVTSCLSSTSVTPCYLSHLIKDSGSQFSSNTVSAH